MAVTTIMTYTGDGATNAWSISYDYLKKIHVKMYLDGVEDTTFTWLTDSSVAATSTPGVGVTVTIKRETPRDVLDTVIPASGTFRGADINNQAYQALYVAEEGYDALVNVLSLDTTDDTWDASSKIIKNVATPTASHHAARKDYVDAVAGSATAAAASASAAASSATDASNSATSASSSASAAASSASAASTSATNALASENAAETAETNAASSASAASTSATNANNSAAAAATSATEADDARSYASEWANNPEDSLVSAAAGGDVIDDYSALHHANKASASASAASSSASAASSSAAAALASESAAANSETAAATSEANAANSASAASTSETNAAASFDAMDDRFLGTKASDPTLDNDGAALVEGAMYYNSTINRIKFYNGAAWTDPQTDAETAETNAAASESAAAASASAASTSETNAASSASAASTSASNAATSETNASNSAAAASTSASNASTSETNAATSETNAAASFDAMDDRFLGTKASDPTLDNDGDALVEGAMYYNSTINRIKFYNGSAWTDPQTDAETAETNAAASESAASTSASNAATSETNAANSASAASTSASNAATSETNAAASYDAFDDRYLGSKASDPTLDNDGDALLTGAIYWNTTSSKLRIWNGAAFEDAAIPASGAVVNTGTPVDNQLAVWTNSTTLEGVPALAFDGTDLTIAANIVDVQDITFQTGATGGTLRTGTSAADKFTLQAYKTGAGAGYVTILELDAGSTPLMQLFANYLAIEDFADSSKHLEFDLAGATTATTTTFDFNQTANRTITFPDATGTVELEGHTHTASEITDFDTEVSNNVDVAANTSKLAGIESGATADQTGAEIKTALFAEADTNNLTDTLLSKLNGIEAGADVTDATNVTAAGALMDSELADIAGIKAFTSAAYARLGDAETVTGAWDFSADVGFNAGIDFGSQTGASATDLSKHIALWGTSYGINITSSTMNFVVSSTNTLSSTSTAITSKVNHDFSAGIDVTGNITVTGTVDGRDIATDGSKLDGIEALADVTDTANVTAAGALMDSELTDIAGIKAFNSANYAVLADAETVSGAWTFSAATTSFTGGIVGVGANDTTQGRVFAYGGSTGDTGGTLRVYNSGANDGVTDYWQFRADGNGNMTISDDTAGVFYFAAADGASIVSSGLLYVGGGDDVPGELRVYGGGTGEASGVLKIYNNADDDGTVDRYDITTSDDGLTLDVSASAGTSELSVGGETVFHEGNLVASGENLIVNPTFAISQEQGNTALTTGGEYFADQWGVAIASGMSGTFTYNRQDNTAPLPGGGKHYGQVAITSAEASVGALEFVHFFQRIEGLNRWNKLRWGTSAAKDLVVRVGMNFPQGTYCFAVRDISASRSYVHEITISSAEAGNDVEKTFVIPGDTNTIWNSYMGTVGAAEVTLSLGCGSTYDAPTADTWASANYVATASQTDIITTASALCKLLYMGLYVDHEGTGTAPPFQPNTLAQDITECYRYFRFYADGIWGEFNATTRAIFSLPVTNMRTFPSLGGSGALKVDIPGIVNYTQSSRDATFAFSTDTTSDAVITTSNWSISSTYVGTSCVLRSDGGDIKLNARM